MVRRSRCGANSIKAAGVRWYARQSRNRLALCLDKGDFGACDPMFETGFLACGFFGQAGLEPVGVVGRQSHLEFDEARPGQFGREAGPFRAPSAMMDLAKLSRSLRTAHEAPTRCSLERKQPRCSLERKTAITPSEFPIYCGLLWFGIPR